MRARSRSDENGFGVNLDGITAPSDAALANSYGEIVATLDRAGSPDRRIAGIINRPQPSISRSHQLTNHGDMRGAEMCIRDRFCAGVRDH